MKPFKAEEKKILIDKARLLTERTFLTWLTLLTVRTCLYLPRAKVGEKPGLVVSHAPRSHVDTPFHGASLPAGRSASAFSPPSVGLHSEALTRTNQW